MSCPCLLLTSDRAEIGASDAGYTAASGPRQESRWTWRVERRIVGSCALGFPLPSYGGRLRPRAPASLRCATCGLRGRTSTPPDDKETGPHGPTEEFPWLLRPTHPPPPPPRT